VQGIDSHVESWTAGRLRFVDFDHGPYSSTLYEVTHYPGYAECREVIGGHPAKLVVLFDPGGDLGPTGGKKYWAAVTWRDYRPGVHLTMVATTPEAGEMDEILAVLRSVRFSAATQTGNAGSAPERGAAGDVRSGIVPE
jgi:hypothetical protein